MCIFCIRNNRTIRSWNELGKERKGRERKGTEGNGRERKGTEGKGREEKEGRKEGRRQGMEGGMEERRKGGREIFHISI